jgi:hypothetical protein
VDFEPIMDIPYLLSSTRSARKSLDLDAPVDLADPRVSAHQSAGGQWL